MASLLDRVREPLAAVAAIAGNRNLRRLEGSVALTGLGGWTLVVAFNVYAFRQAGATGVGVLLLARMLPAGLAAPFGGSLADRFPPQRVMGLSNLTRVVFVALVAGLIAAGAAFGVVIVAVIAATVAGSFFQPARAALVPQLAERPEDLTAANVITTATDSVSMTVGPAIGGLLTALTSPQGALVFSVVIMFAGSVALFGIQRTSDLTAVDGAAEPSGDDAPADEQPAADPHGGLVSSVVDGLRATASDPSVRLLVGLMAAQLLVYGMSTVLITVVALDQLDLGNSGVGLLNTAIGFGGVLGLGLSLSLVGKARLGGGLILGLLSWGLPIFVLGIVSTPLLAVVMFGALGLGNTFFDVSSMTMLQRIAPTELLGRIFGSFESIALIAVALGGALAPLLVSLIGISGALLVTGAILPLIALFSTRGISRADDVAAAAIPTEGLALLGAMPMFSVLSSVALEALAERLGRRSAAPGEVIIAQGNPGGAFYLIASGSVQVTVDGTVIRHQGPSEHFGEIALLNDSPRTATVTALTATELRTLTRADFLATVTGYAPSDSAARRVATARLAFARPGGL